MFKNYVDYVESCKELKDYLNKLDYYGLDGFDVLQVPPIILDGEYIDINDMYYQLCEIYADEEDYFDEHDFDKNRFYEYNDEFRAKIKDFKDYLNYQVL